MIVAQAPLRITLGGGGTDLPSYSNLHGGMIVATAVDAYVRVAVERCSQGPAAGQVVLQHDDGSAEVAPRAELLRHDLARAALLAHGDPSGLRVQSCADLPSGTGLGSSASYLVALLAALQALHVAEHAAAQSPSVQPPCAPASHVDASSSAVLDPSALAERAFLLESVSLRRVLGRQDPYMAALGGLTLLDIARDGRVTARRLALPRSLAADLVARMHLYYTGQRRDALGVLADQAQAMSRPDAARKHGVEESLHRIKDLGWEALAALEAGDLDRWGSLQHQHWELKKRLSPRISLRLVDALYAEVRERFGVLGGKLSGAGGGGFLLLYCPDGAGQVGERLEAFMAAQGLPRLRYQLVEEGCAVLQGDERLLEATALQRSRRRKLDEASCK